MEKIKISSLEISALSTFLYKSFILIGGINMILKINEGDLIISSIIGFIIGFIILFCFFKLNNILPKYNIFEKIEYLFPKVISIFIKILLIIPVLIFSSYSLYNISLFIQTALLNNVDILPISILLIIAIYYLANKGIKTLTKTSLICFLIFIILEIISILFTIPNINSLKILPIFKGNIYKTIYSSLIYIILSFVPIFLLLIIPINNITEKPKYKKYIKLFYIGTSLYLIFNFILVLSVVDKKLALSINYPELFILSKISLLNFFDRMEKILSYKLILDSFFLITTAIIYLENGITTIIKNPKIKKIAPIICCILLLLLCNFFNLESLLIPSLIIFLTTNLFILIFYKIS